LQDDSPLASLPLLGYTINSPSESDGINKEYVFKLQFKTHVYFFRAESQYTFNRYDEMLNHKDTSSSFEPDAVCSVSVIPLQHRSYSVCMS